MPVIQIKNPGNVIQISGLKYARLKKKVSIRELAKRIGKDERIIRMLEKRRSGATETIAAVCKILSISEEKFKEVIEINENELDSLEYNISRGKVNKKDLGRIDFLFNKILSSQWNSKKLNLNCPEL